MEFHSMRSIEIANRNRRLSANQSTMEKLTAWIKVTSSHFYPPKSNDDETTKMSERLKSCVCGIRIRGKWRFPIGRTNKYCASIRNAEHWLFEKLMVFCFHLIQSSIAGTQHNAHTHLHTQTHTNIHKYALHRRTEQWRVRERATLTMQHL